MGSYKFNDSPPCSFWVAIVVLLAVCTNSSFAEDANDPSFVIKSSMERALVSSLESRTREIPRSVYLSFQSRIDTGGLTESDIDELVRWLDQILKTGQWNDTLARNADLAASLLRLHGVDTDLVESVMLQTGRIPLPIAIMFNHPDIDWRSYAGDWSEVAILFVIQDTFARSRNAYGISAAENNGFTGKSSLVQYILQLLVDFASEDNVRQFIVEFPQYPHSWLRSFPPNFSPDASAISVIKMGNQEESLRLAEEGRDPNVWYWEQIVRPAGLEVQFLTSLRQDDSLVSTMAEAAGLDLDDSLATD